MLTKKQYQEIIEDFFSRVEDADDFIKKVAVDSESKKSFEKDFKDENINMLFTNSDLNKALKADNKLEEANEGCCLYGRWLWELVDENRCQNVKFVRKGPNSDVYKFR